MVGADPRTFVGERPRECHGRVREARGGGTPVRHREVEANSMRINLSGNA